MLYSAIIISKLFFLLSSSLYQGNTPEGAKLKLYAQVCKHMLGEVFLQCPVMQMVYCLYVIFLVILQRFSKKELSVPQAFHRLVVCEAYHNMCTVCLSPAPFLWSLVLDRRLLDQEKTDTTSKFGEAERSNIGPLADSGQRGGRFVQSRNH